jgi:hypothetical protein
MPGMFSFFFFSLDPLSSFLNPVPSSLKPVFSFLDTADAYWHPQKAKTDMAPMTMTSVPTQKPGSTPAPCDFPSMRCWQFDKGWKCSEQNNIRFTFAALIYKSA